MEGNCRTKRSARFLDEFKYAVIEEKKAKERRFKDTRVTLSNGEQIHARQITICVPVSTQPGSLY